MKIAIFDHQLNFGGGTRFITNLLININKMNKHEITFYCDKEKANSLKILEIFESQGINVIQLESLKTQSIIYPKNLTGRIIRKIKNRIVKTKPLIKISLADEIINVSENFDLCYFQWPYGIQNIKTHCPKIATFHDFNFKYFWGVPIYDVVSLKKMNENISGWLNDSSAVVSTNFMKSELLKFYKNVKPESVDVVHLPSLNIFDGKNNSQDQDFYKKYADLPYIVCPVHLCSHKNINIIITSASIINKDKIRVRFIFTGKNTELLTGKCEYLGINTSYSENIVNFENIDSIGVGYISDSEMDNILKNSFAVLNASYYEAGNGVGLDAWSLGVPVIQSNIEAHEEHLHLQGFKAFTFDPKKHESLVNAIENCLNNSELRIKNINDSKKAAKNLKWENAAIKYLSIFEKTVKQHD